MTIAMRFHDARQRKLLYGMAGIVMEMVPEINDAGACRVALKGAGFSEREIELNLKTVQRMARVMRGAEADRLVAKNRGHS